MKKKRLKTPEEMIDEIYLSKVEFREGRLTEEMKQEELHIWTDRQREYMKEYIKHQVKFFREIQDALLLVLVEKLERITVAPGERFIRKGDVADGMYILYSGAVLVFPSGAVQT